MKVIEMCLAVPMKIIEIKGEEAVVELEGFQKEINISLMEDIKIGEYVMVHAGFAIQRIDASEIEETLEVLREYSDKMDSIR
jgi:hydrogenase expression/formation protein HypC